MHLRLWSLLSLLGLSLYSLQGQSVQLADTLPLNTANQVKHLMLKLEIPTGESFVRSSGCHGSAIYRLAVPDSQDHYRVETQSEGSGIYTCNLTLTPPKPRTDPGLAANLRLSEQLTDLGTYTNSGEYKTSFCPDPTVKTDLYLDLGVGASRLDLSDLQLSNVNINSAFADVIVHYAKPNRLEMDQMSIHAASANVLLKNLAQARARQVTIHNDMGMTKLLVGKNYLPGGEITIRSGVGGLVLVLDPEQAVELRMKAGFFSEVNMPKEGFKEIADGTYINTAVQQSPNERVIINLEVDFGKITIIER
ncbi:MAG: hypothetical protein AAFQ87_08860 [Bacteroidota bacterium]